MITPPIVEVLWVDCCTHSGWSPGDEALHYTIMECRSVGYLVDKSEVAVTVAQSLADNGDMGEVTCIPADVVTEIRELCQP